jgi:hypothetical protein
MIGLAFYYAFLSAIAAIVVYALGVAAVVVIHHFSDRR